MIKRIILIILLSAAVLFTLSTADTWAHKGEYELISDTSYICFLDRFGKIKIIDIGAGNPVLKGRLFKTGSNKYLLFCPFDSDYDKSFLNTEKVSTVTVSFKDMFFKIEDCEFAKIPYPKPIDKLIAFTLPKGWKEIEPYTWRDGKVITQRNFEKGDGYISVSIFSYKGRGATGEELDVYSYVKNLDNLTSITEGDTERFIGMVESDDTKNMLKRCYIKKGDYVFEISVSNFDVPVTEEQIKDFDELVASVLVAEMPPEAQILPSDGTNS